MEGRHDREPPEEDVRLGCRRAGARNLIDRSAVGMDEGDTGGERSVGVKDHVGTVIGLASFTCEGNADRPSHKSLEPFEVLYDSWGYKDAGSSPRSCDRAP